MRVPGLALLAEAHGWQAIGRTAQAAAGERCGAVMCTRDAVTAANAAIRAAMPHIPQGAIDAERASRPADNSPQPATTAAFAAHVGEQLSVGEGAASHDGISVAASVEPEEEWSRPRPSSPSSRSSA